MANPTDPTLKAALDILQGVLDWYSSLPKPGKVPRALELTSRLREAKKLIDLTAKPLWFIPVRGRVTGMNTHAEKFWARPGHLVVAADESWQAATLAGEAGYVIHGQIREALKGDMADAIATFTSLP